MQFCRCQHGARSLEPLWVRQEVGAVMLKNRDNLIGGAFLVVMVVLAAILIRAIVAGERVQLDLNPVVVTILGVLFFGLLIFGIARSGIFGRFFGGGRGRQWPDPQTGSKSLWDRLRGK